MTSRAWSMRFARPGRASETTSWSEGAASRSCSTIPRATASSYFSLMSIRADLVRRRDRPAMAAPDEPGENIMRFMIIVKATKDSEAGVMPPEKLLAEMAKYHEELQKAGVLLDGSGLQPSKKGWRIKYSGNKRTVIDGPFAETKELIAGYTMIQTRTREE